jgi:hypothetical protein
MARKLGGGGKISRNIKRNREIEIKNYRTGRGEGIRIG